MPSCAGHCGTFDVLSMCNCDRDCFKYDDCCTDYEDECRPTCVDRCDVPTTGEDPVCYCDPVCTQHGDCCVDYEAECAINQECTNAWLGWYSQASKEFPMEPTFTVNLKAGIVSGGELEAGMYETEFEGTISASAIDMTKTYAGYDVVLEYNGESADGVVYAGTWSMSSNQGAFSFTAPACIQWPTPIPSCQGHCGGEGSGLGGCFCDMHCATSGDCCGDYREFCGGTCGTQCGGQSEQGKCWCDSECTRYADCCKDFDADACA